MTRNECFGAAMRRLAGDVGAGDLGIVNVALLVVRDGPAGRCTIIVPCAAYHRPGPAERAQHGHLRRAGYRVVLVRSEAEIGLALVRYAAFAAARREAWANRIGQALLAIELPVLRAA